MFPLHPWQPNIALRFKKKKCLTDKFDKISKSLLNKVNCIMHKGLVKPSLTAMIREHARVLIGLVFCHFELHPKWNFLYLYGLWLSLI